MFVRVTRTPNSPRQSVKVVASVRDGLKVRQVMLHHVGIASSEDEVEKLKQLGREFIAQEQLRQERESKQGLLFAQESVEERQAALDALETRKQDKKGRKPNQTLQDVAPDTVIALADLVEERRTIEGIHDVAGAVYDRLGYQTLLPRKKDQERLKDLVLMRLADPSSKLKAQQLLENRFAKTHDLDAIYRVMDKLLPKIGEMKALTFKNTQQLIPGTVDVLFFDCTTLYFESTADDDLRCYGYSKDHRFNTTQVVLALATNADGLPVGYELFEGNKAEVTTLLACIESWRALFSIGSVCFVADRAMMSKENVKALEAAGHTYVIAAKLRQLPADLKQQILDEGRYESCVFGDQVGRVGEFTYNGGRLIVSYKEDRAQRDQHQRQKVVEKIEKRLGKSGATANLITNKGVKKYTKTDNAKTVLDEEKIQLDAIWDGLHGVITNIKPPLKEGEVVPPFAKPEKRATATEILCRYARLWKIEESFRLNKHTLSMRPIYHFKPERIHAHIAICYMAYTVLRRLEYTLALTHKMSPETVLGELMNVQSSFYRHVKTDKLYRMPGRFSQKAAKIYNALHIKRQTNAQLVEHG